MDLSLKIGGVRFLAPLLCLSFALADSNTSLEKIVVQEQSSAKKNFDSEQFFKPYSASFLDEDFFEQRSIINAKDAIKSISNVGVKDMGSFNKSFSIRGFGAKRIANFVDGMKVSNHGLDHSGSGEIGNVDTSSIKSLKLIKGTPSVVYDPGASGGAVMIRTLPDLSKMKDVMRARYTKTYDEGYYLDRDNLFLELFKYGIYANYSTTSINSKDRAVKNKQKAQKIINDTNDLGERWNTPYELENFGSKQDMHHYTIGTRMGNFEGVYKNSNSQTKDATMAVGVEKPMAVHFDSFDKTSQKAKLSYFGEFFDLALLDLGTQEQKRETMGSLGLSRVELSGDSLRLELQKKILIDKINIGVEIAKDKAQTLTFSEQDYYAFWLDNALFFDRFIFNIGARLNIHEVRQNIIPGSNKDVAYEMVGVSGVLRKPINDEAINYAFGGVFMASDHFNIGLNYSKTYRYPSLYERFAFGGGFIGGGKELVAEEGDNLELTFKYADDSFEQNLAFFYSDFDVFNSMRMHSKIKNKGLFESCIDDSSCDPFSDDMQSQIFEYFFIYTSFEDVQRYGFEYELKKAFRKAGINLDLSIAQTKITPATLQLSKSVTMKNKFKNEPLEIKANFKKTFKMPLDPWFSINARYVSENIDIDHDEFKPFMVFDFYTGVRTKYVRINAGVKNVLDEVYQEAYSPLDGIKRSAFVSAIVDLAF